MGGVARAKAHSKAELRKWGKRDGRPVKLDRKGLSQLRRLLAAGRSQAECAFILWVSVRTVGGAVARMKRGEGATDGPSSVYFSASMPRFRIWTLT